MQQVDSYVTIKGKKGKEKKERESIIHGVSWDTTAFTINIISYN